MTEVFVYVEGPSDQLGMEKLMDAPIAEAESRGRAVRFFPMGGKKCLLNKGPKKAINILRNRSDAHVFIVPDLYPPNVSFPHRTFLELKSKLEIQFMNEIKRKNLDERLTSRFYVHCFKHDLEVLLLAAEEPLLHRLGTNGFSETWVKPVEDQDHEQPSKRMVEKLFKNSGRNYRDTADAPWILERADCHELEARCPQQFGPFLQEILQIIQ